jgi:hypothetical protein
MASGRTGAVDAPSIAIDIASALRDRLYSFNTLRADEIWLCCDRQSSCRLDEKQASGNNRGCQKRQLLRSDHFQVLVELAGVSPAIRSLAGNPTRLFFGDRYQPLGTIPTAGNN